MSRLLRSELLKQRTTRTDAALLGWTVGVVAAAVLLHVGFGGTGLHRHDSQLRVLGVGTGLGTLFASLLGAISITGEFRHGLIRPTFLATPDRARVIAAKAMVSALAGLALGVLVEALTAAIESAGLGVRGIDIELTAGDYAQLIAGGALAAGLFAALGVGVGALVRNQVAALTGLCVWLLFVEGVLLGDVPSVARFLPGASAGAIAGAIMAQPASNLVAPAIGLLLLTLYAAVAVGGGSIATTRRDVA